MAKPHRRIFVVILMIFAGIASRLTSLFGLMTGLWGGFLGRSGEESQIAYVLFWLILVSSFPVFLIFLRFRHLGLVLAWTIPVGVCVNLSIMIWLSCSQQEGCTTSNPILVLLHTVRGLGFGWAILLVAPACLLLVSRLGGSQETFIGGASTLQN